MTSWHEYLWAAVAGALISYCSLLFMGSLDRGNPLSGAVVIFDAVEGMTHTLTGSIAMPSPCHTLDARVVESSVNNTRHVEFTTWRDPLRDCDESPTMQRFRLVTFIPESDPRFSASLDGERLKVQVIEVEQDTP